MRTFQEFPEDKICPICKTNTNKECILVPIMGTGDEPGNKFQNYEADVFHLECIELWYEKPIGYIYQRIKK